MSLRSRHATRIVDTIRSTGRPLTADEVRELLRDTGVGQATVYRALNAAAEAGVLRRVDLPNQPSRYEPEGLPHHHHFHCDRCGRVFDVEGCPGQMDKLLPRGFRMRSHEITLRGDCNDCRKASAG
jgi:Fur family ferric uptake transcriptional regulator